MCMGGGGGSAPAPAQAAPVTSATPEFSASAYEEEKASETQRKKRRGKRGLRIARKDSANVPGTGAGLNIPQG